MDQKTAKSIIDQTIADYNKISDKFSSTRHNITTDLQKLADLLPKDAKVLDYGCGNGRMAALFAPDKYLGVDPSVGLIDHAMRLHPEHNFRQISVGERIHEKFDAILCLAVIHHLPDKLSHEHLLNILTSSLNPGGMLILTAWNLENEPVGPDGLVHKPFIADGISIDRSLYSFTLSEIKGLVSSSGLVIVSAQVAPRNRGLYSNIEIVAKMGT